MFPLLQYPGIQIEAEVAFVTIVRNPQQWQFFEHLAVSPSCPGTFALSVWPPVVLSVWLLPFSPGLLAEPLLWSVWEALGSQLDVCVQCLKKLSRCFGDST
jgi:hypothetical protein